MSDQDREPPAGYVLHAQCGDPQPAARRSNWPHALAEEAGYPDDGHLLDLLLDWVPDEATRGRILVDNPAELYGFPSQEGASRRGKL